VPVGYSHIWLDAISLGDCSMQNADQLDPRRLAWQCRRGIKEVEVLLVPYFEKHYRNLDELGQQRFVKLLAQEDVELFEWFTTRSRPDDADLTNMINAILASVGA
jgi:antitoxin CptB